MQDASISNSLGVLSGLHEAEDYRELHDESVR